VKRGGKEGVVTRYAGRRGKAHRETGGKKRVGGRRWKTCEFFFHKESSVSGREKEEGRFLRVSARKGEKKGQPSESYSHPKTRVI